MVQLTDEELKRAYIRWSRNFYLTNCDDLIKPFLNCESQNGWITRMREAMFLSPGAVAAKLDISRESFKNLENSEQKMTISLANLCKVAEALDCEFVYALRPKNRKLVSLSIWEKIVPEAIQNKWIINCDQKNRAGALAFLVRKKLSEAKFRSKMGWSQRANKPSAQED